MSSRRSTPSSAAKERARGLAALALSGGVALVLGLWGLRWGLPGPARWAVLPPALRGDARLAADLANAWGKLYAGIEEAHRELASEEPVTYVRGVETIPAGWARPPQALLNSCRSFLLRTEQPDEQKSFVVLAQMRPWKLDFKPLYVEYGGAFIYPLGAWLWLASKAGFVRLVPGMTHYLLQPEDMGALFFWGRLYVLLLHLGAVLLLGLLARRCGAGPGGIFLSGALYCLLPLVAAQTHQLKPHAAAGFWLVAAVFLAARALDSGSEREQVLSGACAGLAAGSAFYLAWAGALPALVWLLRGRRRAELRAAFWGAAAAAGVFAALNPYLFLSPASYLWELTVYPRHAAPNLADAARLLGPWAARAAGAGFELLVALALLEAWRRRWDLPPALGLTALAFGGGAALLWAAIVFLWGFSGGPQAVRFLCPLLPLGAALAGAWASRTRAPRWLKVVLLAGALADAGRRSLVLIDAMARDSTQASTRAQAAAWLDANVPVGAPLGLTRYPQPSATPPLRFDRYRLVVFSDPGLLKGGLAPRWAVVDETGREELAAHPELGYSTAAEFLPPHAALGGPSAEPFADAPMYVLRRSGP